MSSVGAMRATVPGLAEEMRWGQQRAAKGFAELFEKGLLKYDQTSFAMVAPNFIRHNPPENPNVVKAWRNAFEELPECAIISNHYQLVKGFLEGFQESFRIPFSEPFAKAMPNQEQEQEHEQEEPLAPNDSANRPRPKVIWTEGGFQIPDSVMAGFKTAYPAVSIDAEIAKAYAWTLANPDNRKSQWGRFLNSWLQKAQNYAPTSKKSTSATDNPIYKGVTW